MSTNLIKASDGAGVVHYPHGWREMAPPGGALHRLVADAKSPEGVGVNIEFAAGDRGRCAIAIGPDRTGDFSEFFALCDAKRLAYVTEFMGQSQQGILFGRPEDPPVGVSQMLSSLLAAQITSLRRQLPLKHNEVSVAKALGLLRDGESLAEALERLSGEAVTVPAEPAR